MKLYAHRGVSGEAPENTMAAFKAAVSMGAHGIELDVQLSKDGQIVVIHDETINRTTNGIGYVKDIEWKHLCKYDAGSWFHPSFFGETIPLLEEVLNLVKAHHDHMIINIELKNDLIEYPQLEDKVLELLDRKGMKYQVILSSFNGESLKKIRKLDPAIETAFLFEGVPADILTLIEPLNVNALHCDAAFAQSSMGRRVKELGMPLRVFTINTVEEFQLLKEAGVSDVITDFPALFVDER
ncbi:glycerophosphodiester phosphodiesterase [Rossellomorea aquimaris]|nr:glycerophosphodiester phosphodiesterase [Rossellomorea aquimaris]